MSQLKRIQEWNITAGVKNEENEELFQLYIDLIKEELEELLSAKSRSETLDALGDILVVTTGAIHVQGADADEILNRINNSNFTKFDTTEEDAKISVIKYTGDKRYENVRYEKVGGYYIIRGDKANGAKNKILKSYKFEEPKLEDL